MAGKKGSQPKAPLKLSSYKGLARKTSCSSSGMGIKVCRPRNVLARCILKIDSTEEASASQTLPAKLHVAPRRHVWTLRSGLSMQFINTELQRCLEASEGGPFQVDVVVHTTATYGDRFRPILKHR